MVLPTIRSLFIIKQMKIDGREIKAIVFDYDGTILDSGDLWHEIDIAFFAKRNVPYPSTYLEDIAHTNLKGAAKITREKYGIEGTDEELASEWMSMAKDAYANVLPLKEGVLEVIRYFHDNGIKLALATAGDPELFEPSLERLNLNKYFTTKINVADVKKNKNHPDIYLEAAKRLGFNPDETIVFEDMPIGLKSAYEAGFVTYAVMDEASKKLERQKGEYAIGIVADWPSFLKKIKQDPTC